MKVEELFIGALVETPDGKNGRIVTIDGRCLPSFQSVSTITRGESIDKVYDIDALKPIPITAEILEKNFERRGESFPVWAIYDEFFELRIYQQNDGLWQVSYDNIEANFPTCRNLICFVHELQMALTLNGIDKEIML